MDVDDILEDLLSWSGSATPSQRSQPQRPSLRESAVNTTSQPSQRKTLQGVSDSVQPGRCGTAPRDAHSASLPATAALRETSQGTRCHDHEHDATPASTQPLPLTADNTREPAAPSARVPHVLELPAVLEERLMPHQRVGVQWLYGRHSKARACLLADEMGLGKTVQVAAFLGELYRRKMIKTTILVVPPTLVPMWESAIKEWGSAEMAAALEVIHGGSSSVRQGRWRKLGFELPCVFITTYGVLTKDTVAMSAKLVDYVVLDEAHLIKNESTRAAKSARALSARHRIALTGTPLMNSFEDLWSLFCFLDGSIVNTSRRDFRAISATLLRGNEKDASGGEREMAAAELRKLQNAIGPFMLRREKKDLTSAVTSAKRDVVVWVRLTEVQQLQYEAFLESKADAAAQEASTAAGAPSTPTQELDENGYDDLDGMAMDADAPPAAPSPNSLSGNGLLLLTTLAQICNHPWLTLVDEAFDAAMRAPFQAPLPEMGDVFAGAKLWVALRLLVDCITQRRKALVFSRSKRLLRLLSVLLAEWGITHTQVDGDMPSDTRFGAVKRFNDEPGVWVCLLTTQVGGVGLTFTAASAVVLMDPSWNPSADAQAVDRVHRIGQTSDVVVYRLVTCGTVEEKVYRNQIFKRMAALQSLSVSGGTGGAGGGGGSGGGGAESASDLYRYFTRTQLRNMFVMDSVDRSSTAEQLERLHPGRIDASLRAQVSRIDGVCALSDNVCVLAERVEEKAPSSSAVCATQPQPSLAPSPVLPDRKRRLESADAVADALLELSEPPPQAPTQRPRREAEAEAMEERQNIAVSPEPWRQRVACGTVSPSTGTTRTAADGGAPSGSEPLCWRSSSWGCAVTEPPPAQTHVPTPGTWGTEDGGTFFSAAASACTSRYCEPEKRDEETAPYCTTVGVVGCDDWDSAEDMMAVMEEVESAVEQGIGRFSLPDPPAPFYDVAADRVDVCGDGCSKPTAADERIRCCVSDQTADTIGSHPAVAEPTEGNTGDDASQVLDDFSFDSADFGSCRSSF